MKNLVAFCLIASAGFAPAALADPSISELKRQLAGSDARVAAIARETRVQEERKSLFCSHLSREVFVPAADPRECRDTFGRLAVLRREDVLERSRNADLRLELVERSLSASSGQRLPLVSVDRLYREVGRAQDMKWWTWTMTDDFKTRAAGVKNTLQEMRASVLPDGAAPVPRHFR